VVFFVSSYPQLYVFLHLFWKSRRFNIIAYRHCTIFYIIIMYVNVLNKFHFTIVRFKITNIDWTNIYYNAIIIRSSKNPFVEKSNLFYDLCIQTVDTILQWAQSIEHAKISPHDHSYSLTDNYCNVLPKNIYFYFYL